MGKINKARFWISNLRIAVAVGKTVLTGKPARSLGRVELGVEIAEQAIAIAEMVKKMKSDK